MTHTSQPHHTQRIEAAVTELLGIIATLSHDTYYCATIIDTLDSHTAPDVRQFWYRTYVRSLFAWIEGTLARMKQFALEYDGVLVPDRFSPAELVILAEKAYRLDAKGAVATDDAYPRAVPNMLFTIRAYARAYGVAFEIDTSDNTWRLFKKALDLRHTLMHPKIVSTLMVAERDIADVRAVCDWFANLLYTLESLIKPAYEAAIRQKEQALATMVEEAFRHRSKP